MTAHDIFQKIAAHQIEGVMTHTQLSHYYDFLDLHGLKRQHEYHALKEFIMSLSTERYYINHFGTLLIEGHPANPAVIPANWQGHQRTDVTQEAKKRYVRDAVVKWVEWEKSTKKMYEQAYKDLCDIGEVAAACKVKELVEDVDQELKYAERQHIKLESIGYDLPTIFLCQDDMHEEYREKEKHLGVDIC